MASLQNRINSLFQYLKAAMPQLNTSTGTVAAGLLSGFASEMTHIESAFSTAALNAFLTTATGSALDALARDHGLSRDAAAPATGTATLSRSDTSTVLNGNAGALLSTNNLDATTNQQFITTQGFSFAVGQASVNVPVVAQTAGSAGNIGAGTLTLVLSTLAGVSTVTNSALFTGGVDAETDAALRVRVLASLTPQNTVTRINAAALGVTGIASAATFDQQDQLGSVYVYACDSSGNLAANSVLANSVKSAVDGAKSLGSTTSVMAPVTTTLNINYDYAVDPNFQVATVQQAINNMLTAYFSGLKIGQNVRPFDIIQRIIGVTPGFSAISGVVNFKLNTPSSTQVALPWQLYKIGNVQANLVSA